MEKTMEQSIKLKLLARLFLVINLTFLFLTFANSAWSKNFVKMGTIGPRLTLLLQILLAEEGLIASERRLEPQRLFSLLNLDTASMKKIKSAAEAGDFVLAEEVLLRYMRNRKNVRTVIPWRTAIPWRNRVLPWRNRFEYKGKYASKEDMAIANDALKHIFGGHYVSWYLP